MTKTEKLEELMKRTGKSKMACDIALQLAGNDVEKAIDRMRISYPSMKVGIDGLKREAEATV